MTASLISQFTFRAYSPFFRLAHIARLEAEANTNPQDLSKQVALWNEFIRYPAGQKRIISRYERLVEFDKHSPLIRSPQIFQIYLRALLATDQTSSIDPAVRHRDVILALPQPERQSEPEPLTESQTIAKELLATATSKPKENWLTQAKTRLSPAPAPAPTGAWDDPASISAGDKGNPVHVIVEESRGSGLAKGLKFVFLTFLYAFIALTILSLVLENTGIARTNNPSPKSMEFEAPELMEIVQFLKDPSAFSTLGGRLPKGVLLTGPPGTGKTLLARAVAGEAGVPFLFASGSEFDEMYVGVGARRIRELFAAARKKQPAIIFIDELDAIGGRRSSRDNLYIKQTLNQLLVELDGFSTTDGVIILAATNFPEALDKALVRPGRFDKTVSVPLPDIRGRIEILRHHMRSVLSSPEVDVNVLARGTPGFSGAELENMINQAAIRAARNKSPAITLNDFEWAKDKILMGAERVSAYIPEDVKRSTAVHEGGHALVALYTPGSMPLHKVTCMPRGHALGITQRLPLNDRHSVTWLEYMADIDVSMGGRMAEELVYGKENVSSGASSDLRQATSIANSMIQNWGYSNKVGLAYYDVKDNSISTQKRHEIESEVDHMLSESAARLTDALVEYETLDANEVRRVIGGSKIRDGILDFGRAFVRRHCTDGIIHDQQRLQASPGRLGNRMRWGSNTDLPMLTSRSALDCGI
ncbi:uncharacterized protein EI90DRAFT_3146048 [Cantharellus anzutake]|uniref:uncharacterized protein n=1 Tax=Cantharellus anzutake TaxID=1750568 RepID=UPI0019075AE9|nr:uncharacterized protein EI90DRAFT_3146048 [Cantharellus anzutake]KAF8329157.1 hypothetical protein EI90DRAFT_3146048 [Cantharellus anzutake]